MPIDFSNLVVAFQAVVPMFCLMFIGVMVKYFDLLNAAELKRVNRMVFRVFFSIMMFYNLYTTNIATTFRPRLIAFALGALAVVDVCAFVAVCFTEKTSKRRGAMIQAILNFLIVALCVFAVVRFINRLKDKMKKEEEEAAEEEKEEEPAEPSEEVLLLREIRDSLQK